MGEKHVPGHEIVNKLPQGDSEPNKVRVPERGRRSQYSVGRQPITVCSRIMGKLEGDSLEREAKPAGRRSCLLMVVHLQGDGESGMLEWLRKLFPSQGQMNLERVTYRQGGVLVGFSVLMEAEELSD